jgi:glycosyltransferase involved in cell wall biosynthesis
LTSRYLNRLPLQVTHTVPALFSADGGILGGAERYALELARHMAARTPTTLLSFGPRDRDETVDNLRIRIFGNPIHVRGLRSNPFSFRALAALRAADVIHCHQRHIVMSSMSALLARLTGKRVFVSDLGGGGWDISRYISTENWYHGHLHISRYSRHVSNQSESPRAHVIMGGVDTGKFSPNPAIARTNSIVYAGRILPHKGVNYLIEALPPGMRLEIVGQAYHQEFLRELQRLAERKDVVFHHDFTDSQLIAAYRSALCVVLPSVYRTHYGDRTRIPELLGQTLLEGMACGAPAICTDVASMPEIVENGVTGFVVPPNDPAALREKLIYLRDRPAEAATMGQAARRRVLDQFTWPAVVTRCLDIYEQCR